jgi:hypothetical protein
LRRRRLNSRPWAELFQPDGRSRQARAAFGSQQLFGGIGALAAGTIVKTLLDHPRLADGQRFAVLFGAAGAVLTLSALVMSFARDLRIRPSWPSSRRSVNTTAACRAFWAGTACLARWSRSAACPWSA